MSTNLEQVPAQGRGDPAAQRESRGTSARIRRVSRRVQLRAAPWRACRRSSSIPLHALEARVPRAPSAAGISRTVPGEASDQRGDNPLGASASLPRQRAQAARRRARGDGRRDLVALARRCSPRQDRRTPNDGVRVNTTNPTSVTYPAGINCYPSSRLLIGGDGKPTAVLVARACSARNALVAWSPQCCAKFNCQSHTASPAAPTCE